ncbi:hypothetical protein [Mogibacterium timidum]|mgnify:CR=1 FL=1|uniref:Uncharacterized protein n=1 Tax=Mogibacterium timidum TaxID=35519 RepID=A0A7Y9B0M4_9FIRM|nr:hypothetical protein [Mogibacterium timidum]NWO23032.1 hypothetical protein [Mogibacterium timidum]
MTDKLKIKKFSSSDVSLKEIGDELEKLGEDELISIEFIENSDHEEINNGEEN